MSINPRHLERFNDIPLSTVSIQFFSKAGVRYTAYHTRTGGSPQRPYILLLEHISPDIEPLKDDSDFKEVGKTIASIVNGELGDVYGIGRQPPYGFISSVSLDAALNSRELDYPTGRDAVEWIEAYRQHFINPKLKLIQVIGTSKPMYDTSDLKR